MITSLALIALAINAAVMFSLHRALSKRFSHALGLIEDAFETQRSFNSSQMDINSHHAVLLAQLLASRPTNVLNLSSLKKETDA